MYNNNNQPKIAQSFGQIQSDFKYSLYLPKYGDQYTIMEDLPRTKQIRQITKSGVSAKGPYSMQVNVIRVSSNGFEADMELKDSELKHIAVLFPKDTQNFKGCTFSFDGQKWISLGIEGTTSQRAAPDARQPDLSAPAPVEEFGLNNIRQMLSDIKTVTKLGVAVKVDQVTKICDTIAPGKALDMIKSAKEQGMLYEKDGVYIVV